MVCSCGGSCRSSDILDGKATAHTCPACGRRQVIVHSRTHDADEVGQVIDFSAGSPPQASIPFALSMEPIEIPKRRRRSR